MTKPSLPPTPLALLRFQIVSAYLAMEPTRGQRGPLLARLAARRWRCSDGREHQFAAETIRSWVRAFQRQGLAALENAKRAQSGVGVLTDRQKEIICRLKRDVPARSILRIIEIAEEGQLVPKGLLRKSTVHRVLSAEGISKRPPVAASITDLDRFQAAAPNDLWQSDMLAGPYLTDPATGKRRQAWLHAYLDDYSRLILAGRWSFNTDLHTLEIAFRDALRKHGIPKRIYYDNGAAYRSNHMAEVIALLSESKPIFTQPYRPQGHGKIEAFNRYCRAAFIEEIKASAIDDLDALNLAFSIWIEHKYNRRNHGQTNETPLERWNTLGDDQRVVTEEQLARAFVFRARRKTDKCGTFKLYGKEYQAGPELARRYIQVHYKPDDLTTVTVLDPKTGVFQERVGALAPQPSRRAKEAIADEKTVDLKPLIDPMVDLVAKHKPKVPAPDPIAALKDQIASKNQACFEVLKRSIAKQVWDEDDVRTFLARYGPFDPSVLTSVLGEIATLHGEDQHIQVVFRSIRELMTGDA